MIVFEEVVKRYPGGYTALAGVSFEIRHGELVVLSGHSGAGKSTLMKLIPVIERPSAGTVRINGQDVSHLPQRAIPYLRRNLGLVLQEIHLLHDRSV
ncbi:MAG: ATP-binding cassette domain-containing protein, partial [Proteobacteria bacterium]|nr:ATP-binding cassette domain-containing protein [Pseudomonadota bacterium]